MAGIDAHSEDLTERIRRQRERGGSGGNILPTVGARQRRQLEINEPPPATPEQIAAEQQTYDWEDFVKESDQAEADLRAFAQGDPGDESPDQAVDVEPEIEETVEAPVELPPASIGAEGPDPLAHPDLRYWGSGATGVFPPPPPAATLKLSVDVTALLEGIAASQILLAQAIERMQVPDDEGIIFIPPEPESNWQYAFTVVVLLAAGAITIAAIAGLTVLLLQLLSLIFG